MAVGASLVVAVSLLPFGGQSATRLAACEALRHGGGSLEQVAECLSDAGDDRTLREEAITRLEALREQNPGNPWPTFHLAYLEWYRDASRSADVYVLAAGEFASTGRNDLAVTALLNAARMLGNAAAYDDAMELVDRAAALAVRSSDPSSAVKVQVDRAHLLYLGGRDLAGAYRILLDIEPEVRAISATESANWLDSAAKVTYDLGLLRQSLTFRRQLIDELSATGDTWSMAQAKYGFAITYQMLYESSLSIRDEYLTLLRDALETARRGENETVEALARLELGKVLGDAEGRAHLERCIEGATERNYERGIILCSRALAELLSDTDMGKAVDLLNASIDRATAGGDLQARIFGAAERVMIRWRALPRRMAVADALATLDLIETYRRMQSSASGRTGVFSVWAPTYQRVAGLVLGGADDEAPVPEAEDIAVAFEIVERMRARTLLDDLEREMTLPSLAEAGGSVAYASALRAIVRIQGRLLDPDLDGTTRTRLKSELRRAENDELALRDQMAADDPRFAAWAPEFAGLDAIRAELEPDEALLSFQVSLWKNTYDSFAGGAWLVTATREAARAYRIPDRTVLDAVAPAFAGLVSRRDGAWQTRAASLYRALLGDAVEQLPAGIDKLILIPDGPLHRLPFGVLAPAGGAPLADRYALSIIPSATLWLRWRNRDDDGQGAPNEARVDSRSQDGAAGRGDGRGPEGPTDNEGARGVLVLADPALAGTAGDNVVARVGGGADSPQRLGPLPYARIEANAISTHLGDRADVAMGEAATEALLKQGGLGRYGIIHFAAHAVLDEDLPERSAVYLAPGSRTEDGLLQSREIAGLPLDGKIIVLSGCQSAAGALLQGEGVMSLARSFFQAGATTVIGSLWPLRDDDAAALFDDFYRHLARGASVATAMQAAQADRRAAGAPATAWAGMVVLGDGAVVPFRGGLPAGRGAATLGLVLLGAALLALLAYRALRR